MVQVSNFKSYPRAEYIPEIADSVDEFQKIIDGLQLPPQASVNQNDKT